MKKQILYEADGYTYIDVLTSHDEGEFDVIINCPHGYHDDGRFRSFPYVKEALKSIPKKTLETYLWLEFDFGAKSLAEVIFHHLAKTKRVAFINLYYDRGILDGNRSEACSVRQIFNQKKYSETTKKLQYISHMTGKSILEFSTSHLAKNGLFLDVHSMWPTCQYIHPRDFEHENRLAEYTQAILYPQNQKNLRSINFLVHDAEKHTIADVKRSESVAEKLRKKGYPVKIDSPYFLLPGYRSTLYYQHFSGISLDVPRTFLGKQPSEKEPEKWQEEEGKIKQLGQVLAEGVLHVL